MGIQKNHQKEILFFSLASLILVLDQLTKYLILRFQPEINLKFFSLHLVKNTGAGFGLLKGYTLLLTLISFLVAFLVIFYYKKIPGEKLPQLFSALFLGGVIGNLIDRLLRGWVVDFIDFGFWPAFNLADAGITVGVVGLVVWFWGR